MAYIDDALQRAGLDTKFVDLNIDKGNALEEAIESYQPDYIGISLRNIDDIIINIREYFVDDIADLIKRIRLTGDTPIILGGSGYSIFPKEVYEVCKPDFGITGEGEHAIVMLINGESHASIPGLVYKSGDTITANPVRLLGTGEVGTPIRDQRIMDYFLQDGGMVNIQSQRGCPLKCVYCTYPVIEGRKYRLRSGESIAQEILELKKQGAKYVFIVDSVFNTSKKHVRQVCEALIAVGSPLPWGCFLRPKGLSLELAELMRKSGLTHVEFGSDSLNTDVLKTYGKMFTFEDILESSRIMKVAGIYFCHFVIFGGPGESEATMDKSFENSKLIEDGLFFPSIGMRVYPGTPLFRVCKDLPGMEQTKSMMHPTYFISDGLTEARMEEKILEYSSLSPDWVDIENNPDFNLVAKRLRKRGVVGPLWNYLSVMRRFPVSKPAE